MRLLTFRVAGEDRLGALVEGRVVDLHYAYRALLSSRGHARPRELAAAIVPNDMNGFLAGGAESLAAAREAIDFALARSGGRAATGPAQDTLVYEEGAVDLRAPVPNPGKIICVGLNYRDHILEMGRELPKIPVLFAKFANTVNDPGAPIPKPIASDAIDYEGELAAVIGRRARHVREEDALEYVAGYTILNDVSVRDYQNQTKEWLQGKTWDGHAPMGPHLVTRDEVDGGNLELRTLVNGELRQHANTNNLVFTVPFLVAFLSRILTLEPGDIISTGTPGGVGQAHKPPRYLKDGDVVRIEIEGLGVLENPVVDEARLGGGR